MDVAPVIGENLRPVIKSVSGAGHVINHHRINLLHVSLQQFVPNDPILRATPAAVASRKSVGISSY